MNRLILFLVCFIFSTASAIAMDKKCTIFLHKKIYYVGEGYTPSELIKKSDCSKEINFYLSKLFLNSQGELYANYISRVYEKEFKGVEVKIYPDLFVVQPLAVVIKKQLGLMSDYSLANLRFTSKRNALSLQEGERIVIGCSNCNSTGSKNISLKIVAKTGKVVRTFWAQTKILLKTKVLVAQTNLPAFKKDLTPFFKERFMFVENPSRYSINRNDLKYYKLNKDIQKESAVTRSDLTMLRLIRRGALTKVVFDNDRLKLTVNAIAKANGVLNQIIHLFNSKSKKIIVGRVIDFNKVRIEI